MTKASGALLPEDILPAEELSRLACISTRRPTAFVWALLDESDAEALRSEVGSGRTHNACGLLLNCAVKLVPIAAALPERISRSDRPG